MPLRLPALRTTTVCRARTPAGASLPAGSARGQRGATLVEPLVAAVVAGTLAATALPRLTEAMPQARASALATTAAVATQAMQLNQMGCALTDQQARDAVCTPVSDCAQVAELLLDGLPADVTVAAQAISGGSSGQRCTLALADGSASAGFIGIATGQR